MLSQQFGDCVTHRCGAFDDFAESALGGGLLGVSAVGYKRDCARQNNRPAILAGKAGEIGNIGGFCGDETIGAGAANRGPDALKAGFICVLIHS